MQTNEELSKLKSQVLKARETETHMAQQMIKVEAQVTEKSKKSNRKEVNPHPRITPCVNVWSVTFLGPYYIRGTHIRCRPPIGSGRQLPAPLPADSAQSRWRESELEGSKPGLNFQGKEVGTCTPPSAGSDNPSQDRISRSADIVGHFHKFPSRQLHATDCRSRRCGSQCRRGRGRRRPYLPHP